MPNYDHNQIRAAVYGGCATCGEPAKFRSHGRDRCIACWAQR